MQSRRRVPASRHHAHRGFRTLCKRGERQRGVQSVVDDRENARQGVAENILVPEPQGDMQHVEGV